MNFQTKLFADKIKDFIPVHYIKEILFHNSGAIWHIVAKINWHKYYTTVLQRINTNIQGKHTAKALLVFCLKLYI